ncbi:hypothetical protein ABB37_01327 [Leptomonas pyrrhocoris]|uniref:Uncharacterized protein n=1 Tax=Leptomonas pyrrhocoris TaxID=157538 RepID=A0A0N0VH77_LEPPY|nr:hypothetical protein ABB37_01327 [Leptomonas pyrrhocoris]KPA84861.1 hypothetical protein ABB37_01327 [Leptomonas pyrrhocoris]|eukprot:XP_015663300.1 hypothetical protein ABB37_01327 [Leptomonas pyrrhocoris]
MTSNYSISSSEGGSLCPNAASHQTQSRNAPCEEAAAGSGRHAVTADAASATRHDVTPKKAAQSSKSATAATAQESPSMTIRRLPVDYSKRMDDQKVRSNALERYKMLVKANRLVPGDNEASPEPKKTPKTDESDMSTTWRRSDQMPSTTQRDGSAISQTVLSNASDGEALGKSQARRSADPLPPSKQQQQHDRSLSSLVSVSVSVERPAYPSSVTQRQDEEPAAVAAVPAVPSIDLTKTLAHQPGQQQQPLSPAAMQPPANRPAAPPGGEEDAPVDYVSPELTQPFGSSKWKPRNSIRPGYTPVTEHRSSSLTRTSSVTGEGRRTPRTQQPDSQVGRPSTLSNGTSTPRRKSTVKTPRAAAPAADVSENTENVKTKHVDVAVTPTDTEEHRGDEHPAEGVVPMHQQSEDGVVPLPGSKTAFWLRPATAMYEMTTSIAAKRKDHVEQDSPTTHTSSRRGSHSFHAIPSGNSSSLYGTPRDRGGPNAAPAPPEEKLRFSTHMSAADRKLYEEGGAAVKPPPLSTYDAIFSNRRSTVQRSSGRRSQKLDATAGTTSSSATPRGTAHRASHRRAVAPRVDLARSFSTLSRLSSNAPLPTPTEGPQLLETERVSTRQHDALTKHCARVAARAEGPAVAAPVTTTEAKTKKVRRSVPAASRATATSAAVPSQPQPRPTAAPGKADAEVHKKLEFEVPGEEAEEGEEPVPQTVVPKSCQRFSTPARQASEGARGAGRVAAPEASSPPTTLHGCRSEEDATPSKSRRREHDVTASLPREETTKTTGNSTNTNDADEACFVAQDAAMAREKEAAHVQRAREVLEGSRLARQARAETARTLHNVDAGTSVSTNEVVAAMLQGIVQQTRQVLPCYLCGELQCTSGYHVHVKACRPKTEGILREYFTAVAGLADIPAEVKEHIDRLALQEVPSSSSDVSVRDAFAKECYQCVKSTLVPCRKCGTHLRVQDVKEHEMLCGRAYYQNSRAAERVRSAVDRIERGSQE